MALPPALKKSMPALGKFGIWLGISTLTSHLTSNPELVNALATAGVGVANLDAACGVISSIASGKLGDYYKDFRSHTNFGINHNLQEALREGISNALHELGTTFLKEKQLPAHEQQQIGFFFQSLAHHLNNEINADAQVDGYVLDRAGFFRELLRKVHALPTDDDDTNAADAGVLIPDLSDATAERLVTFLVDRIEPVAQRFINEEFKTNDKAKTAYFIHLLEYGARTSQDNNELLQQVSESLDDIGKHQQEHTDLLRQIAQAQQRIYDVLRTLKLDFQAYISEFGQFKARIDSRLEPSLRLNTNYTNLNASFSYQYGLRYTSFISRDTEIDQLWDFLNGQPTRRLLWWLVTGPGGMGKSRLALEFCLEARCVNRYVGFVETDHLTTFDWSQWRPAAPTLLVVDYVAAYAGATQKMIGQLSRNAQNGLLAQPVRVLLLERETRDDWWNSFLADRDIAESSYVPGRPEQVLKLPAFTDADRWQIITEIHRKQQKPVTLSQAETLRSLADIDPDGRPLFAFLTGMAMAGGEDIRRWDVHALLNNLLHREETQIWATHPNWSDERCREGHKNLMVLTTLTRGLSVSRLKELLSQSFSYLPDRRPDAGLYERLSDIRKRELPNGTEENVYEGLQPDLVGEYYVLKRIEELLRDDFTGEETVQALLQLAWNLTPEETWWSIYRTGSDFSHFPNPTVRQYIETSRPLASAPEMAWLYWANLRVNLTTYYGTQGNMLMAQTRYEDLQSLAKACPENQEIVLAQAKGAYNLTTDYGRQGDMVMAQTRYKDLQSLAKAYPENQEIVLAQAEGAYNLTTYYGTQGNMVMAQTRYEDLQSLAKAYPENQEIVLAQAKGAYNLTTYYGTQGNMVMAEAQYVDLQTLAAAYPHNEEIVLLQAEGAMNLTTYYGRQGDMVMAQTRYKDLQSSAKAYPEDQEIVLRQAMGAGTQLYFTSDEEKIKHKPHFLTLLEELETLLAQYEENEHWQERLPQLIDVRDENQWLKL
ncbi:MAG: ATP-binding protein [Spirosoma sp.]|nr:ATP-binding protein [Spirosoma sp.]